MKRVLVCAVLIVMAGHTDAHANWRLGRAVSIADRVWHRPCNGTPAIVDNEQPPSLPVPGELIGPDSVLATTDPAACTITLRSTWLREWDVLCPTIIHEFGHLAGYRDPQNVRDPYHSANPWSVMSADYGDDPRCDGRGRAYLRSGWRDARSEAGQSIWTRSKGPFRKVPR